MRSFNRYKRNTRITHHPILAIDFENNPESGHFICAGIVGEIKYHGNKGWKTKPVREYFDTIKATESYLMGLKQGSCLIVFFNAAYDKAFIPSIIQHDSVLQNGGRVITMKLRNGLKCIDLTNHVAGSLADWIGYLEMPFEKATLDDLKLRVMTDAEATFRLGQFIEDFYVHELGVAMRLTTPSTALRLFAQRFFKDRWVRRDDEDYISAFERKAYYGGRTELFKRGMRSVNSYDVNSMYLSVMRNEQIPDMVTYQYVSSGRNWEKYFIEYLGIFHCRVFAPNIGIQILPWRNDKGKLIFPSGHFEGSWTNIELREALAHGYKIEQVYNFIYYRRSKPYFSEFANLIWDKRQEYKAKGNFGMEMMIKKMGNSLYGKFGQLNQANSYQGALKDAPKLDNTDNYRWRYYPHPVTNEAWVTIYGLESGQPPAWEFPAVCAFITSYARIVLYRALEANIDNLVYCDTDSLKVQEGKARNIAVGKGLGEWGFEGEGNYVFFKPKWYGDKCKGVPKRGKLIDIKGNKAHFVYERPLKERESLPHGIVPNKWIKQDKYLDMLDDKRRWHDDTSSPLILDMINGITFVDYPAMDKAYGYDASHYPEKMRLPGGGSRRDDMSEADRNQAELEEMDKRRSGDMIYQRQ